MSFSTDIKEEVRRFLVHGLGISSLNIDEIKTDLYKNGQLRNIRITFIPSIKGEKEQND